VASPSHVGALRELISDGVSVLMPRSALYSEIFRTHRSSRGDPSAERVVSAAKHPVFVERQDHPLLLDHTICAASREYRSDFAKRFRGEKSSARARGPLVHFAMTREISGAPPSLKYP